MDRLKDIGIDIASVLISGACNAIEFQSRWHTLIGTPIPFVDFDCSTLDEFLRRYFTHRVIFGQEIDGTTMYELIVTDTIAHIARMVDATKCKSNRKSRSKRSKSVQYRTTTNNANRLPPTTDRNHQQTVIEAPSSVTNTIIEESKKRILTLLQSLNTTTTYDQLKSTYLDHYHQPLDANEMHRLFGCKHPLVVFYRHFSNEIITECNDSGLIMLTLRVKQLPSKKPATNLAMVLNRPIIAPKPTLPMTRPTNSKLSNNESSKLLDTSIQKLPTVITTLPPPLIKAAVLNAPIIAPKPSLPVTRPTNSKLSTDESSKVLDTSIQKLPTVITTLPPPLINHPITTTIDSSSSMTITSKSNIIQFPKYIPTPYAMTVQTNDDTRSINSLSTSSSSNSQPTPLIIDGLFSLISQVDCIPTQSQLHSNVIRLLYSIYPTDIELDKFSDIYNSHYNVYIDPSIAYRHSWHDLFNTDLFSSTFICIHGCIRLKCYVVESSKYRFTKQLSSDHIDLFGSRLVDHLHKLNQVSPQIVHDIMSLIDSKIILLI